MPLLIAQQMDKRLFCKKKYTVTMHSKPQSFSDQTLGFTSIFLPLQYYRFTTFDEATTSLPALTMAM